jgi:Bacterial lipid A biosynthesis acyltransferase
MRDTTLRPRSLPPPRERVPSTRYLRATAAVARSGRSDEYLVAFVRSGFWRTDWLGAKAVRALLDGFSDVDAVELVEKIEPGAGARARQLIDELAATGGMTSAPVNRSRIQWRIRRLAGQAMGIALQVAGPAARALPAFALEWGFRALPYSPVVGLVWRSRREAMTRNLIAAGYDRRSPRWLRAVGRACAAVSPRNGLFLYLSIVLPRARVDDLVRRLVDQGSADAAAARLESDGPAVCVFLHGPLVVAVPNALRRRGQAVVRAVTGGSHGTYVSRHSGTLGEFFGDSAAMAVEVVDAVASAELLRHLRAGRSVYVALERSHARRAGAEIELVGHRFPRNDGPAWLAVRSGRPIILLTTRGSRDTVIVHASDSLRPDSTLPVDARVADLSARLYAQAEAMIGVHPEAWPLWGYLDFITVPGSLAATANGAS